MKINIDKELEEAHKQYEEEKKGVLWDLMALNSALFDLTALEEKVTPDHFEQFHEIISKAYKFIEQGEI